MLSADSIISAVKGTKQWCQVCRRQIVHVHTLMARAFSSRSLVSGRCSTIGRQSDAGASVVFCVRGGVSPASFHILPCVLFPGGVVHPHCVRPQVQLHDLVQAATSRRCAPPVCVPLVDGNFLPWNRFLALGLFPSLFPFSLSFFLFFFLALFVRFVWLEIWFRLR